MVSRCADYCLLIIALPDLTCILKVPDFQKKISKCYFYTELNVLLNILDIFL